VTFYKGIIAKDDRVLARDEADWGYYCGDYNHDMSPSLLERRLAGRLERELGVHTAFIPRGEIAKKFGKWESPAIAAKGIAKEEEYDAFAMIYFQPMVTILNDDAASASDDEIKYAMMYNHTFVVRSTADDALLCFKKSSVSCEFPEYDEYRFSSGAVIRQEKEIPNAVPQDQCEIAIQAVTIEEFIAHVGTIYP